MFLYEYFRLRRRRYNLYGILAVTLSFWLIIQGTTSLRNDYVFRDKDCIYSLDGVYKCNNLEYDDCTRNNNYNQCSKANSIRELYVTAVLYPTIYFCLVVCYTIYYCYYHKQQHIFGYFQCCYILWIVCSFISMILFFQSAKEVDDLINIASGVYVNEGIKGISILFGILHMIHLVLQCIVSADIHYEVVECTRVTRIS